MTKLRERLNEMPETGADIRGALRTIFPKLSPEKQERLRHTRSPLSQFTPAEIESPHGTITPQRTRLAPESFFLMPGITAEKILKRLEWNPVSGEVLTGSRLGKLEDVLERIPKSILDYVKDVRYMSRRIMNQIAKEEGRPALAHLGGMWEPRFTRGAPFQSYHKPGTVLLNPRSQNVAHRLHRWVGHEVGHGGEEAIRRSMVRKPTQWWGRLPGGGEAFDRFGKAGLMKDYPREGEMLYELIPHEQWARAFDEYMTTGGKMLSPDAPLAFGGNPPPPLKMRNLLRKILPIIEEHGIP